MNQIDTIDAKQQMIAQMDEAVSKGNSDTDICANVMAVLEEFVRPDVILLDPLFLEPKPESYARRLFPSRSRW